MRTSRRFFRALHAALVYESRDARAAEVANWSNAAAALGLGAAAWAACASWPAAAAVASVSFVALRLALAHRATVWIAAAAGSTAVGGAAAVLAWLFAHVIEHPLAPPLCGMAVGVAATLLPASAYSSIARRRADAIPDSLLEGMRPSRPSSP